MSNASDHTANGDVEKKPSASPPPFVGFWSKDVAQQRKAYLIGMAKVTFMVTLMVWSAMALYWVSCPQRRSYG